MPLPTAMVERAAEAILNQRGMRRGIPPITGILAAMPDPIGPQALEDAHAALEAAAVPRLLDAVEEALATLAALAARQAPNGRPWIEWPELRACLFQLRNASAAADGRPEITDPGIGE